MELSAEWTSPSGYDGSGMETNRICEFIFYGQGAVFPLSFHYLLIDSTPSCQVGKRVRSMQQVKILRRPKKHLNSFESLPILECKSISIKII